MKRKVSSVSVTADNRVVSNRQQEHTHSGNEATAVARKAVGEMKAKMGEMTRHDIEF